MSHKRIFSQFGKIVIGLFGISAIISSCAKEKTCVCTYTYTYDGVTESYEVLEITTKTKGCEEIEIELIDGDPDGSVSCKEK